MEGKRDEAFDVPLRVMDAVKKTCSACNPSERRYGG
jgi:hypothetical protein